MQSLKGKLAVITGAASGVGAALATTLDAEGMRLALVDVEPEKLAGVAESLSNACEVHTCNVADPDEMEQLAVAIFSSHSNVHVLFNNAGVMGPMAPLWELKPADWRWVFDVNVQGIANGIRAFIPRMLAQTDPAHVVNTASEASFAARAFVGVYHASKHAVLAITETLAQELEFLEADIRVSVVCPGAINSALMDAERNRPQSQQHEPIPNEYGDRLANVYRKSLDRGLAPEAVAEAMLEGVKSGRFYILPHPEVRELPNERAAAVRNDSYPEFSANLARLIQSDPRSRT